MESLQVYDIYDFVDDGVNESIYTILTKYHPFMKRDFSLGNMINHMRDVNQNEAQEKSAKATYEKYFTELADCLVNNTNVYGVSQDKNVSDEKREKILGKLSDTCKEIPECKDFRTIRAYVEFAKNNIDDSKTKALRDSIVSNAVEFFPQEEMYFIRNILLKGIYLDRAIKQATPQDHKTRKIGDYPELDKLKAFNQILMKRNSLQEYDEFYYEAQAKIRDAALKAMEKARIETVCSVKRGKVIRAQIGPSISKDPNAARTLPISTMFDELKRIPRKGESEWRFESLKKPELVCDLEAEYSKDGIENQRVVVFRYGKLKYKEPKSMEGLNIDRTADMPDLIGVTRIGSDGTNNYFVLMPPLDRLTFRPMGEGPKEPGEKPYGFTITHDVQVQTRSGATRIERRSEPANLVDGKTGEKLSAFKNKEIPESQKEFFAKVFFSDEYLHAAIENNAKYIGSVVETDNGLVIRPADVEKQDLAGAYYASYHPGLIDGVPIKSFSKYCDSHELLLRQYNAFKAYDTKKRKEIEKKDNDAR